MNNNACILASQSSLYLAQGIAAELGLSQQFRAIEGRLFPGGERYYRVALSERTDLMGAAAILVASTHTDEDLLMLQRVGCALAGYGAQRRVFVIPFLGYSTMERAVQSGEIVTAKTNARILSSIPNSAQGNVFLMLDLHTAGLVHYFEGDCLRYELYAQEVLVEGIRELGLNRFMFASADLGRPLWVQAFADKFQTEIAFIRKRRSFEQSQVEAVIGQVEGKQVVIYDDMTRTAGSLIHAAEAYLENGATEIYAVVSHLALNDEAVVEKILQSPLRKVIATNSHPMSQHPAVQGSDRFIIKDVGPIFATVIRQLIG